MSQERNIHFSHLTACVLKNQTSKTTIRIGTNSVVQWTVQQKAQLKEIWKLKKKTAKTKPKEQYLFSTEHEKHDA